MKRSAATLLLLLSWPATAGADAACAEHFFRGEAPALTNPKLARDTSELCFSAFVVLYSGVTRTPLWAAEHLTPRELQDAEALPRKNSFHAEPSLPKDERAELDDYKGSGFDRGHMAPDGDMPNAQAEHESFSLANMVPQDPHLNRGLWAGIEGAVRALAAADGEVYVVTGPIFAGEKLQQLNSRVLVPTQTYKAVYDPKRGGAGAYVAENDASGRWEQVSVAELARLSGIDAFPALTEGVKVQAMSLPEPAHGRGGEVAAREPGEPAEPTPPPAGGGILQRLKSLLASFFSG